jgi:hypothetical protein
MFQRAGDLSRQIGAHPSMGLLFVGRGDGWVAVR